MAGKPSFADALKKSANEQSAAPEEGGEGSSTVNPSRRGAKHIGGYFPPEVGRQLRTLAAVEDTSNQKTPGRSARHALSESAPAHDRQQVIPYRRYTSRRWPMVTMSTVRVVSSTV